MISPTNAVHARRIRCPTALYGSAVVHAARQRSTSLGGLPFAGTPCHTLMPEYREIKANKRKRPQSNRTEAPPNHRVKAIATPGVTKGSEPRQAARVYVYDTNTVYLLKYYGTRRGLSDRRALLHGAPSV